MATETPAPTSDAPAPVKKPGLMTLIKAVAILVVLIIVQVLGVSMLVPSSAETAEIAQSLHNQESEPAKESEESAEGEKGAGMEMKEVSLGEYHVVTYDVQSGSSTNVDFELYGTVLASEELEFEELYTANEVRLREQILVIIRGANDADLTDPDLDLIKRQILEKTNRTLGKPLVCEAIFSKFTFLER